LSVVIFCVARPSDGRAAVYRSLYLLAASPAWPAQPLDRGASPVYRRSHPEIRRSRMRMQASWTKLGKFWALRSSLVRTRWKECSQAIVEILRFRVPEETPRELTRGEAGPNASITPKNLSYRLCGSRMSRIRVVSKSPRTWGQRLSAAPHCASRTGLARLIASAGLRGKDRKKDKGTTNSNQAPSLADDLVQRWLKVREPNTVWAAEISF
jgi:hypothetical protein